MRSITKTDLRFFLDSPRHLWAKFHNVWHPEFIDFDKKTAESYMELAGKLLKLPIMRPDCSYKVLPINHGDQASSEWIHMSSDDIPPEEKAEIKENLFHYCELDTWAMVRIWQELRKECLI